MKQKNKFSISARSRALFHAFSGVRIAFTTEHNLWIHFIALLFVTGAAIFFKVSITEAALLTIVCGFVIMAELVNTAIEKIMDFISEERRTEIKLIKDISAGSVLIAAITALITGLLIFLPKLV